MKTKTKKAKVTAPVWSLDNPLWRLERDGLTQGFINNFLNCRYQTYLNYWEGWTKDVFSEALAFGIAFHDCLSKTDGATDLDWQRHRWLGYYSEQQKADEMPFKQRKDFELMVGKVHTLASAYRDHWQSEDEKIEWVVREEVFKVKTSLGLFTGRWDGVFRDKDGRLWIHETKTASQIDEDGIALTLPFNVQSMLYSYAAQEHFQEPVHGVLYDVIRKPQIKQGKQTLGAFLTRIKDDIAERPKFYYLRWRFTLSQSALKSWKTHWLPTAITDITDWAYAVSSCDKPINYMNPSALVGKYGRCQLFDMICTGSKKGYHQRSVCYPELED